MFDANYLSNLSLNLGIISSFCSGLGVVYSIWGDRFGNLYASAFNNAVVYKISSAGVAVRFAGGGTLDAGSGCLATAAVSGGYF